MSRLKLLFAAESFGGGVFTYLSELSHALADEADIVIVYSPRVETPADFPRYFPENTEFIRLDSFTRALNPVKDLRAIREFGRLVKELKPDIVHLHSSKAGAVGRLALRNSGLPVFYTPHGYSYLAAGCGKIKGALYRLAEKLCAKTDSVTVACGEAEYIESKKLSERALCVYNGVNIRRLREITDGCLPEKKEHRPLIYTMGRMTEEKRPQLFAEVARLMPNADFLWIGDGDGDKLLGAKNISCTGWLPREEALRLAARADAFILTSEREGLSLALLEAMYMKKLCAVSRVVGNREVIRHGENGFLCDTARDFADALGRLLIPGEALEAITETAYGEVMTLYNTGRMAEDYLKIYKEAIEQKAEKTAKTQAF